MILTCPNCQARFNIPDQALGTAGRKVRCSSCRHSWHALPESVPVADPAGSGLEPDARPLAPEPAAPPVADPSIGEFAGEDFDIEETSSAAVPKPEEAQNEEDVAAATDDAGEAATEQGPPVGDDYRPAEEESWVAATDRILAERGSVDERSDVAAIKSDARSGEAAPEADDLLGLLGNRKPAARKSAKKGKPAAKARAGSGQKKAAGRARARTAGWVALALFVIAVPTAFILLRAPIAGFWPASRAAYDTLGLSVSGQDDRADPRTEVLIGHEQVRWESTDEGNMLHTEALVRNRGSRAVDLPTIDGVLRTREGTPIKRWEIKPDPARIDAGATRRFSGSVLVEDPPVSAGLLIEYSLRWPPPEQARGDLGAN